MNERPLHAHLTEDELDAVLLELAEPATITHVKTCAGCAARLQEFREQMGAFNEATLGWSEARARSMPVEFVRAGRSAGQIGGQRWSYATAAVAGLAMLVAGALHGRQAAAPEHRQSVAAGSDYFSSRQQEIKSDNAMLSDISAELYQPITMPEAIENTISEGHTPVRRGESMLKQAQD